MVRYAAIIALILVAMVLGALAWDQTKGWFQFKGEKSTSHQAVLKEVEALGKLELVKYNFKDVVEHEVKYKWVPNSKVILMISGEAVGCIDLQKIKSQNITEKGDTIYIKMPDPEICYFKVNHQESKVYDTKFTYFNDANLVDEAYKAAEKEIQNMAIRNNILAQTKTNADKILKPTLEQITKKKVVLTYDVETKNTEIKKK